MAGLSLFNGGKMESIFIRDHASTLYTPEFTSEEAKEAFLEGRMILKVDGSNHCLFYIDEDEKKEEWVIAARYDDQKRKYHQSQSPTYRPLPETGALNPAKYHKHAYLYRLMPLDSITGKKQRQIYGTLYDIVHAHRAILDTYRQKRGAQAITFEAVGTKFNRTPGVEDEIAAIALHDQQPEITVEPRTFERMRDFLLHEVSIEGVVVSYKNRYWKIRSDGMVKGHKVHTDHPRFIRPIVLRKE